jgi:thioredoxin 1
MAVNFSESNFQKEVMESSNLSVVDFWAEWCGPCRMVGPIIEELSKDYEGKANIGKVNVDENPDIAAQFGIRSIPTILFIKNGEVVDRLVGAAPKGTFQQKIDSLL